MISIGKVAKAQGIKGEIKINLETNFDLIENLNFCTINNATYTLEKIENRPNGTYLKLKEINDRNSAENLRNFDVFVEKNALKALKNNEFYFSDIIDAQICDVQTGEFLGKILDIEQYGSADIIYILQNEIEYSLPFLDNIFIEFDENNKIFYVNKEEFDNMKIFD